MALRFDPIGYWSEIKLDIIKKYALAYSRILAKQPQLYHVYIDAFAGAGEHISKTTGKVVPGSPLNALMIEPPFREYHLIDLDVDKVANLEKLINGHPVAQKLKAWIYLANCNPILLNNIFPRVRYEDYRRALCLLDPYGLHLDWEVIHRAGQMRSIDIFLNFPIMDMNRNVIWQNPDYVDDADIMRMNAFWGDASWRTAAYQSQNNLLGQRVDKKMSNEEIVKAFRDRLRTIAGFKFVPEPLPMRNSRGATVYYLFFASHNETARKIVDDIFQKYGGPVQNRMEF